MSKRVIISGYIGFNNFGDEMILSVLLNHLKSQNIDITVISKEPEKTSQIYNVKSCATFDIVSVVKNILNSDILISGGGSVLQDVTSVYSLFYYLFVIFIAKLFNKKVIIYAQGIGPINNKFAQIITNFILKTCNLITVRDIKSQELLETWHIKAILQDDPLFNISIPEYTPKNIVGIQLRKWKDMPVSFISEFAETINKNFSDKKINIYSFQNSIDFEICKEFEQKLNTLNPNIETNIIKNDNPNNIVNDFKNLEYLIAMRFHACLLGLKFGIKTLAINYDTKVSKLANAAGIPIFNFTDNDLSEKINGLKTAQKSNFKDFTASKKFDFNILDEYIC